MNKNQRWVWLVALLVGMFLLASVPVGAQEATREAVQAAATGQQAAQSPDMMLLYLPMLIVMGFLVTIIIILVWGRDELTKLLAGYVSPEMAGTLMDSGVKLALQAGYSVAARIPGQTDEEALDFFSKQAGYERTLNPDGSHTLRRKEPVKEVIDPLASKTGAG